MHAQQIVAQTVAADLQAQRQRLGRCLRVCLQVQQHRLHERFACPAALHERLLPQADAPFLRSLLAVIGGPTLGLARDPLQALPRRAHHQHRNARGRRRQHIEAAGRPQHRGPLIGIR
ncbi:hypothetical protein G6F57_020198 [Rhizopus arrhizus]|nr:hypothetical protein G6F58_012897 [Rhizopus delemar]KAG1437569.1 hypothetical protein G6F57_020198 [Rhizopus arrhizus]